MFTLLLKQLSLFKKISFYCKMAEITKIITTLTIVVIIMMLPIVYFITNPVAVPCLACDKGGMFYKCSPGTGDGSQICEDYKKGEVFISDIIKQTNEIRWKIENIDETLKRPFRQTKQELEGIAKRFTVQIPDINIPEISLPNINCGVTIPIINKDIDPCSLVNEPLKAQVGILNSGLNLVIDQINGSLKEVSKIFSPVLESLRDQMKKILDDIQRPWIETQAELAALKESVVSLATTIQRNIIRVVIYQITNRLQKLFPFMSLTSLAVLVILLALVPIVGGYYSFFLMILDISKVGAAPFNYLLSKIF